MKKTQYSHLEFYNNSLSKDTVGNTSNLNGSSRGIMLGGAELTPGLMFTNSGNEAKEGEQNVATDIRSTLEKQIDIVEYLKKLPADTKATFIDISRELNINLAEDIFLLDKLKNHEYIEHTKGSDGTLFFNYRSKNKRELMFAIDRVKTGIALSDIKDCYDGLEGDVVSMIVGGELIAIYNKEKKTFVLFPRGLRFWSALSGFVTAKHGKQMIKTSDNLTSEVRRGEAIKVGEYWYRVSCAVGSGAASEQTQKSTAPNSVTSDKDLSADNVYTLPFTAETLPLDGDFDIGQPASVLTVTGAPTAKEYSGPIFKHGCTNDVKDLWKKTAESIKTIVSDDNQVQQELFKHNLIRHIYQSATKKRKSTDEPKEKKKRHRLREYQTADSNQLGVNAHLKGTVIEKVLQETRNKYNQQFR